MPKLREPVPSALTDLPRWIEAAEDFALVTAALHKGEAATVDGAWNSSAALVAATADVAGDKVAEARKRLAAALDSGKELIGRAHERAVDHAKAAGKVARENPYQTLIITFGVGAVIGFLATRSTRNGD